MGIGKLSRMLVKLANLVLSNSIRKVLVKVTQSWLCFVCQASKVKRSVQDITLEHVGFSRLLLIALNQLVGRIILMLVWHVGILRRFMFFPESACEFESEGKKKIKIKEKWISVYLCACLPVSMNGEELIFIKVKD